jgi:tetratricopeptide (TPR) repeat protein
MAGPSRIAELQRRVEADPASVVFAALAEELRRAGRFDEAIATCRTGLERHPSYLSAHVTLGRSLIEIGQYDEAREELAHVRKLAPENLAAIRGLAEIHDRTRDTAQNQSAPDAAALHASASASFGVSPSPAIVSSAAGRMSSDPALAGLEEFLNAIRRARSEGAAGR